jgi:K+-sensing histidine kinase KdpD
VAFSAGGDGEKGPPELPTTTHRSFATASHRRQSILGPPEKCEVAQPISLVLVAFSAILLTSVVLLAVDSFIGTEALAWIYLLPVIVMAMHYGSTVGVLTSFASALAAAYFCFPPKFSFFISDPLNVAELGFFLLLTVIASKAVAVVTRDERVTRRPKWPVIGWWRRRQKSA